MTLAPYNMKCRQGMPPDHDAQLFLIDHSEHGLMMAQWQDDASTFLAVGFTDDSETPVHIIELDEDERPKCLWHAAMPLASISIPSPAAMQ